MIGRRMWAATVCAVAASCMLAASVAQANWGPSSLCGIKSSPKNEHCYATSSRAANDLGSIDFADDELTDVFDWASGGFVTQEQWITFSAQSGWIEMGETEGNYIDCCTDRPFFAEQTPTGVYHERIAEGSPGTNVYAHYLIYDTEQNAIWRMYWGEWSEEERYGGWSSVRFQEQEAGTETATRKRPYDYGRDEVARWLNGSSPWYPWTNPAYEVTPSGALCMHQNQELLAEGNIEWKVGSC